jgi:hypothetical protein
MNRLITTILLLTPLIWLAQSYKSTLQSESDYTALSGLPLSIKYGEVSALKLVYDLKTDKIYYFNSKYFKYHHQFCSQELNYTTEVNFFNDVNYSNSAKRRFLLANINYFKALDTYALELSPVDQMSLKDIHFLYKIVSNTTFISDRLKFLLNSARLNTLSDSLSISTLSPSKVYKNQDYQAISKYKRCGTLKFVHNLDTTLNPTDIIVIEGTPLYLSAVNGVITNEFQTPLSHLSILGQNRKIPIATITNANTDTTLLALNNQKVCFKVQNNSYTITKTSKLSGRNQNNRRIKLKSDLEVDTVISIEFLTKKSFRYIGNKASYFGILYKLSQKNDFKVPESAFAIPFYFYHQHIINSSAKQLVDSLLNNKPTNQDSLKQALKDIRNKIKDYTINDTLINSINKIAKQTSNHRLRFRSSTNAEDAKNFSGAGLYTSKTGIYNHPEKTYEKAIKKVWASLWSFEAFSEREYYNIDHSNVYMGILVHRSFPNEDVNGVAITKNLYRPDSYGFIVNAQLGNENVVNPTQGVTSDQFICYPNNSIDNIYSNKTTIDIITQSSLNDNQLVMTEEEIQNLANQLEVVKKHFVTSNLVGNYLDYGLDIEFKIDGEERILYFKQVRVFND